jgi:nucleoside-diphosphate-sugar epimerase
MPNNNDMHVVFGASGGVGSAVVRGLVKQGKRVRGVNRRADVSLPVDVENVVGNPVDLDSTRQACEGASVIYHCAHPFHKHELLLLMTDNLIAGASAVDAKLIFADNVYAYGKAGQLTEDMPYKANFSTGRDHAAVANKLMEAHKNDRVQVAIGRASNYYGPNAPNSLAGEGVFRPALEGKTANTIGNIDAPHTYTFIDDFARGLITLGDQEEALGEIWHLPSAETLTTRQFINLVFEEAGNVPKIRAGSKLIITVMSPFSPLMRHALGVLYQFSEPFIIDHSKYERAFGAETTPHREAIRQTLDWYRATQPE